MFSVYWEKHQHICFLWSTRPLNDVKLFIEINYYNIPSIQRQGCPTRLQIVHIEAQRR
jgi:hypothetical protein